MGDPTNLTVLPGGKDKSPLRDLFDATERRAPVRSDVHDELAKNKPSYQKTAKLLAQDAQLALDVYVVKPDNARHVAAVHVQTLGLLAEAGLAATGKEPGKAFADIRAAIAEARDRVANSEPAKRKAKPPKAKDPEPA